MKVIKLNTRIRYDDSTNDIVIDFDEDAEQYTIHLCEPELYESDFTENVFHLGYRFSDETSSRTCAKFTDWLDGTLKTRPFKAEYEQIICKPLKLLDKSVGLKNFKCFVYPKSDMSALVSNMIDYCEDMCQHNTFGITIESLKDPPCRLTADDPYTKAHKILSENNKILIIEDINATGSSLKELIGIVRSINPRSEIYIFTLVCNDTHIKK